VDHSSAVLSSLLAGSRLGSLKSLGSALVNNETWRRESERASETLDIF
jgi:hypothetical protein